MKQLLFLILLIPAILNAQIRNRYVASDSTIKSVELKLNLADGRTITLPGIQRAIFFNDSTFIARYPDSSRLWFPYAHIDNSSSTTWGLMSAQTTQAQTEQILALSGIPIVRVPLYFVDHTQSNVIDNYLDDSYDVQINFNFKSTSDTVEWCVDTSFIRQQAEAFFSYYAPYKNHIPVVVIENEWDNQQYHSGNILSYVNELRICTEVGHKYGFKIADGGITDGAIKRWYNGNYPELQTYLDAVKNINIDYINFHWYVPGLNPKEYDLQTVAKAYQAATGNHEIMNNEFGLKSNDLVLWQKMISSLHNFVKIAIAYSGLGTGGDNRAITLNTDMLKQLR